MTTLAVRFDQELTVAHQVDRLPCPQGVVITVDEGQRTGSVRQLWPCALPWAHGGVCEPLVGGRRHLSTACGLSLDEIPFVVAPSDCRVCPSCFAEDAAVIVEEAMFA
jgi:hypothetical protein